MWIVPRNRNNPRFTFLTTSDILESMNSKEFSLIIEGVVKDKRPITYMDAIIWYCEQNQIEVESVGRLISKALKEKIHVEAANANLLKIEETGKLPV